MPRLLKTHCKWLFNVYFTLGLVHREKSLIASCSVPILFRIGIVRTNVLFIGHSWVLNKDWARYCTGSSVAFPSLVLDTFDVQPLEVSHALRLTIDHGVCFQWQRTIEEQLLQSVCANMITLHKNKMVEWSVQCNARTCVWVQMVCIVSKVSD